MKTLRVNQCSIGKFNLLGNEETLQFSMSIIEDGKQYEENGIRAVLNYSGDVDNYYILNNALNNLEDVFELCYKDGCRWMGGTDYEAQTILFAKVYKENYEEINKNLLAAHKIETEKKIEELKKQLLRSEIVPNLDYQVSRVFDAKIKENQKMIDHYNNKLADLKEDSESFQKEAKYRDKYLLRNEILKGVMDIETMISE